MTEGYVYILTNRYVPDLVKIGYTDRDPSIRAAELSNTTGVPGKWNVHKSWLLENAYAWEQRIFVELDNTRETGEFFRLSPQAAVEKISTFLASWHAIDASGLSKAGAREAERLQKIREQEQSKLEAEECQRQVDQARSLSLKSLTALFKQISAEINEHEASATEAMHSKWGPWFRRNSVRNAFIWGCSFFLAGLVFARKTEGAVFLGVVAAIFAYFLGDKSQSEDFQLPLAKAKEDARGAVLQAHKLGYILDKAKITSTYHDPRGFSAESIENWERIGYSTYDPKFKNKQTGKEIGGKSMMYIAGIGYFDESSGHLLV